jgi:UDP-2,4-diacetamido-2,4,6-trideoxy-beta-L-altropyranose hydrolase
MSPATLLIRADASVAQGTGHVMRCLALAQAWQSLGGRAVFAMAEQTSAIGERLRKEGMEVVPLPVQVGTAADSDATNRLAARLEAPWIVADGYRFGADYQQALQGKPAKLLFVDDNGGSEAYPAAIVLNQNVYADERLYARRGERTRLLLGLKYALLRREYWRFQAWQRQIPAQARHLLVTMGGSDETNFTARVLRALPLIGVEGIQTRIAIGGSNPHRRALEQSVADLGLCVELLHDVGDMAELIAWADVGVAAAGSVSWEICLLGLPSLLIAVAENQRNAARALEESGAARVLSPQASEPDIASEVRGLVRSASSREQISRRARALLDAEGARRVAAILAAEA